MKRAHQKAPTWRFLMGSFHCILGRMDNKKYIWKWRYQGLYRVATLLVGKFAKYG
jgi:hypothetical protein